jgi:hypothetical protein
MELIRSMALLAALTLGGAGAALAQAPSRPRLARTPHVTDGKTDCLSCHGAAANASIKSVPAAHNYPNEACLNCHRLAATMPPFSKHAMDATHTRCATCHVEGSPTGAKVPPAASHDGRHASTCTMCHQQEPAPPR